MLLTKQQPGFQPIFANLSNVYLLSEIQYSNLCTLCEDQTKCKYSNNANPARGPLNCLKNGADVVYTLAEATLEFFKDSANDRNDYKLLCRDGSTQEITDTIGDCTWRNQPWTLILSKT